MPRIHPTALIEPNVVIGEGTAIWDNVHIRHDSQIGEQCIIGEKTYIAYGVQIGHRVKINAMVYVCNAVTIEDGVMISAGTIFTNDRFPRSTTPDLKELRSSDPDEHTLPTLVREGATIGAACTIGNDLVIGRWAMVGMGAVVTKSVPDFHLVLGSPARSVGAVCRCGQLMVRFPKDWPANFEHIACPACGLKYSIHDGDVEELGETRAEGREPEYETGEAAQPRLSPLAPFSGRGFLAGGEGQVTTDLRAQTLANERRE